MEGSSVLPAGYGGGYPLLCACGLVAAFLSLRLFLFLALVPCPFLCSGCAGSFFRCVPCWLPSLSVGGAGLPCFRSSLASCLIVQGWEHRGGWTMGAAQQGQNGSKRAEKGQKLRFLWGGLVFPRCFAIPKQRKIKIFLNLRGKRWVNYGRSWLRSSVALGACFRLFGECWRASVQSCPLSH